MKGLRDVSVQNFTVGFIILSQRQLSISFSIGHETNL